MGRLSATLRDLGERFQSFAKGGRQRPNEPPPELLSFEDRRDLEQQVEDMLAVAEVQGMPGYRVLMRENEEEKRRRVHQLLVEWDVHRFAGKRGVQARGQYQEMDRLGELATTVIKRGAGAQAKLNADARARAPSPVRIVRV